MFYAIITKARKSYQVISLIFLLQIEHNEKMKIGINATAPIPRHIGGSEVYVINLIDKIGKFDSENEYYIFVSENNAELYNFSYANYRKIVCGINSSSVYKRIFYEHTILPSLVKKYNLDLLHVPQTAIPFKTPPNTIVTIHETIRFIYPELVPKFLRYYYAANQYVTAKKVKRIIAVSENDKREMLKFIGLAEDKVVTIYNGVSDKFLNCSDKKSTNKLPLPEKYIFWAGRPYSHKNLSNIIEAFAILQRDFNTPHSLVLVGLKGFETQNVLNQIDALNLKKKIKIFDFVDNDSLPEIYAKSDVFVFPSLYESFGIPIIEAMASGTPVVASNTTSLPEIVGDAGILVNPHNPGEIAEAIHTVLSNSNIKDKLVAAGYERAKKFSWNETVKQTVSLYKQTAV